MRDPRQKAVPRACSSFEIMVPVHYLHPLHVKHPRSVRVEINRTSVSSMQANIIKVNEHSEPPTSTTRSVLGGLRKQSFFCVVFQGH